MTAPSPLATPLAYALAYAALGWHVLPLEPKSKVPLGRLVPRGHLDATIDTETISRWWRAAPDAGIGIALAATGLVVVDIDPRNGGDITIEALEQEHGRLTSDVLALTGGGGEHRVFSLPTGMHPSLPGTLGPGVDVKCNGYIVVEPSVHPNGRTYFWEASSSPLDGIAPTPLSDWLRGMFKGAPKQAQEGPRTAAGRIAEGGRNKYLSARGYALQRAGIPPAMLAQALAEINASDCDPPLDADEIAAIATGKRGFLPDVIPYVGSPDAPPDPRTGLVLDMAELEARAGQLRWAVKNIIPEVGLGFIYGASGTFKSFVALDLALHQCYGMQWLNCKTKKTGVVYLAAEGGAGLLWRIKAWHQDRGMDWRQCPMRVVIVPLSLRTEAVMLREAITATGGPPVGSVFVDTLSQTYTGNENSNDEMAEWLRTLGLNLRDALQCVVTIVHHTGHLATERPRGASAILANADFCIGVFREGGVMTATLEFSKVKDAERPVDASFSLTRVVLGTDEDGDEISSLVATYMAQETAIRAELEQSRLAVAAGTADDYETILPLIRSGEKVAEVRRQFYESLPSVRQETRNKRWNRALSKIVGRGYFHIAAGRFEPGKGSK